MFELLKRFSRRGRINFSQLQLLYVLVLLFALHSAIPLYANSGYLETLLSERVVGIVFSAASIATLFVLLNLPKLLSRFGIFTTASFLIVAEIFTLLTLGISPFVWLTIIAFIVHLLLARCLFYMIDIFTENLSAPENTGTIRGILLTVLNIAILLAPLILGLILGSGDRYALMYLVSAVVLVPSLFVLSSGFKDFRDPVYEEVAAKKTTIQVLENKDLFNIFAAGFLLRFFFAWMTIYTPIYLITTIGFEWSVLGPIFTFMLLPFVLFQIPIGKIADKYIGEKEMLTAGFIITGLATMVLSFITVPNAILWAVALFFTRFGAAFIETTTESYFFKQVGPSDTSVVALYRTLEPIAYIVAPVVSTLALLLIDIRYSFIVLGSVMFTGIIYALGILDSK